MDMYTMPAGTYYIGDLCYVMHKEWDEVCEQFFAGRTDFGCNEGKFRLADGRKFACFNTKHGDGVYYDTRGRWEFGVDAGNIGCIKVEDIKEELPSNAVVVTFQSEFVCYRYDGDLVFGDVQIDTDPSCDEEEEEED